MPHVHSVYPLQGSSPSPDIVIRHFTRCEHCAIWRPVREDSVADDYGLCPRLHAPCNRKRFDDGCRNGVRSKE